jgi:hypothetical protein
MQLGAMTVILRDRLMSVGNEQHAAPRTKCAYAIPRALGTVACSLGFVINFFAKPVDALASRAQSLRTPLRLLIEQNVRQDVRMKLNCHSNISTIKQ